LLRSGFAGLLLRLTRRGNPFMVSIEHALKARTLIHRQKNKKPR
jgi:hypothetical protein